MARHQTLAQFEFFVLIAVDRLGDSATAARVRTLIEERATRATALGAVYAALGRMEDKGFVLHDLGPVAPVRGGRAAKRFRLTAEGRHELDRTRAAVERMLGQGDDLAAEPSRRRPRTGAEEVLRPVAMRAFVNVEKAHFARVLGELRDQADLAGGSALADAVFKAAKARGLA